MYCSKIVVLSAAVKYYPIGSVSSRRSLVNRFERTNLTFDETLPLT